MLKLIFTHINHYRVWEGISCSYGERKGQGEAVCDEGAEEGDHRAEEKGHGAHTHREECSRGHKGFSLPRHATLRLSDKRQASLDHG